MIRKPLWSVTEDEDAGGSGADDEEEPDDDAGTDDGDGEGDDDEEPDDAGDKAKKALDRQKATIKRLRQERDEARAAARKDDDADPDEAVKAAEAKWKPRIVNSSATAALLAAGADKPERLLKLLDHDELEVTDDGKVEGLDDEVERLKEDYPELFATPRRRSGGRLETGDRSGKGTGRPKTASERQAAAVLGSSR